MFELMASTPPDLSASIGAGLLLASLTKLMPPSLMFLAFQYVVLLTNLRFSFGTYCFTRKGPAPSGLVTGLASLRPTAAGDTGWSTYRSRAGKTPRHQVARGGW